MANLNNSLEIFGLLNTYVKDKDPKMYDLLKFMTDNLGNNTTNIEKIGSAVSAASSKIANVSSDNVLAYVSLRV